MPAGLFQSLMRLQPKFKMIDCVHDALMPVQLHPTWPWAVVKFRKCAAREQPHGLLSPVGGAVVGWFTAVLAVMESLQSACSSTDWFQHGSDDRLKSKSFALGIVLYNRRGEAAAVCRCLQPAAKALADGP